MVQHFSEGLGHASSQVSYMVVSKYHFLYVESNIEQILCTFEFILDGKITIISRQYVLKLSIIYKTLYFKGI